MDPRLRGGEMTSSIVDQSLPLGKSAAMLALSAGLEGVELELQKMLIDEQTNNKIHRTNFQTLKAEHASLQEEFTRAQGEFRCLQSEKQAQQEKFQLLLAEQQDDLLNKNRELEELRRQVMTPHQLELLRAELQQEMEAPVKEQFNQLVEEAEKYRTEYNKLGYENSLLQSQMEHQREESAIILERRRIHYEAEVSYLEKEREDLVAQYQGSEALRDGKRMAALVREREQLHLRVKGLEAEVAELRVQKENLAQQSESDLRTQTRQLSEAQLMLKTIEAEHQSQQQELERIGSEIHVSREQNSQLTGKLHKAEREVNSLTCQIKSLKHSHKQESATVKLQCARSKEELEREKATLQNQIDGLQADVEQLKTTLERHKDVLVEKERELVRKVQSAREDALRTTAALHEQKVKLETRLAELEQQRAQEHASDNSQKTEWEEHLRKAQKGEKAARRELKHLRNQLHQQSSQSAELERQKAESTALLLQNQELSVQLATLSHSESGLMETNQRLKEMLDRVKEALKTAQAQGEKSQHEAEGLLEERRVDWLEEKQKLQEHDAELQQKYCLLKEKLQRAAEAQKKRKTQSENKEKLQQDQIQLLEAKIKKLELEAAAAKRRSSPEEQVLLKRRLKELQQRHNDFQRLLLASQGPVSLGPTPLTSSHNPLLVFRPEGLSFDSTEDLSALRQRLDNLENAQQQQLVELGSLDQR